MLIDHSWWLATYGPGDWMRTLFGQPLEVHAFLLGGFLGFVLASLTVSQRPGVSLLFTLIVVLFTFGTGATDTLCSGAFKACQHLRVKPWYFLGGFAAVHFASLGMFNRRTFSRSADDRSKAVTTAVVSFLAVVAVGLAVVSLVSGDPTVQPITGLATLGGLLGTTLGYLVVLRIAGPATDSTVIGDDWTEWDPRDPLFAVGFGTLLGFAYPRLIWNAGLLVGAAGYPFGRIVRPLAALPSVAAYVAVIIVVNYSLYWIGLRLPDDQDLDSRFVVALVYAHAVYAVSLYVLTGLAGPVWFQFLTTASG